MCPRPIVVVDVLPHNHAKMPFAEHDDVVEAFASNRADQPLGIRVLPRRMRRYDCLPDLQGLRLTRKSLSIDLIAVPDQIPGRTLHCARLEQLARGPFRGRMLGDIEMYQPAPAVRKHHAHEEDSKRCGRHREEVQRDEVRCAVLPLNDAVNRSLGEVWVNERG